jgi:hypothetical protein
MLQKITIFVRLIIEQFNISSLGMSSTLLARKFQAQMNYLSNMTKKTQNGLDLNLQRATGFLQASTIRSKLSLTMKSVKL